MDIAAKLFVCAVTGLISFAPPSRGATIVNQSYTGSFPTTISGTLASQDQALEESVSLASSGTLTVSTGSYATGGFEPNLTLYNAAGQFVTGETFPGSYSGAMADAGTGLTLDGYFQVTNLSAGNYTITLTDFLLNQSATATNLSEGFASNYGDGINFVDEGGNTRTGDYALTVDFVSGVTTPEPATLWLTGPVLAGLMCLARRRFSSPKI